MIPPVRSLLALAVLTAATWAEDAAGHGSAALAEARALSAAGNHAEAAAVLRRSLLGAPDDRDLREALRREESVLAGRNDAGDDLSRLAEQAALVSARQDVARAELLAGGGRFADADAAFAAAEQSLHQGDRTGAAKAEAERIARRRAEVQAEDLRQRAGEADRRRTETLQTAYRNRDRAMGDDGLTMDVRIARIITLQRRGEIELALARVRRLLAEQPGDPRLESLFAELFEAVHAKRGRDQRARDAELRQEMAERIERSLLPGGFDGRPRYPAGWLDRHKGRVEIDAEVEIPGWKRRIDGALANRITIDVAAANGVEVLKTLAAQGGVNMVIAPEVQAAGEMPVTLKGTGMTLANAIGWTATQMGATWATGDGAIYVGGIAAEAPILRIHDASAAIFAPKDAPPGMASSFGSGAGGGGGGGFNLFGGGGGGGAAAAGPALTPNDLIDTIKRSIDPKAWENPAYGITVRGTALVVTASQDLQRQVAQFIRSQERAASAQVRIDMRFVTLTDNLIEEIGVNWNNIGPSLLASSTPNGVYRTNGTSSWAGQTNNVLPGTATAVEPAIGGTGLTLQGVMLRNADLSAIFTATERTQRGTVMGQADVVTVNAVRATAYFGRQFSYIADYDIVGNNLDPRIEVLSTGVGLDVKPFISSDRRTVTLDLQPTVTDAEMSGELLLAPRVIPGGEADTVTGNQPFPLDLVNRRVRSGATTMRNIPDRASVLIGGFGNTIEEQAATRVPVLGSVPFLGRLFGQRGRYSQRSQYYLVVSATIIDYANLEAQL